MDGVAHVQGLCRVGVYLPSGFGGLFKGKSGSILRGSDVAELLGKLSHHVTARDPHRQL